MPHLATPANVQSWLLFKVATGQSPPQPAHVFFACCAQQCDHAGNSSRFSLPAPVREQSSQGPAVASPSEQLVKAVGFVPSTPSTPECSSPTLAGSRMQSARDRQLGRLLYGNARNLPSPTDGGTRCCGAQSRGWSPNALEAFHHRGNIAATQT